MSFYCQWEVHGNVGRATIIIICICSVVIKGECVPRQLVWFILLNSERLRESKYKFSQCSKRCVPIWPEGGTRGQDLVHGLSFLLEEDPCRPACEQGSQQLLVWAQGDGWRERRRENRMCRLLVERSGGRGQQEDSRRLGRWDKGACIRAWATQVTIAGAGPPPLSFCHEGIPPGRLESLQFG